MGVGTVSTSALVPPQSGSVDPQVAEDFLELKTKLSAFLAGEDLDRIEEAFLFSCRAHEGQFRISGEPYVTHPIAVANIVADWHLDAQALMAALLHDVMEDTHISRQEIEGRFGKVTADMVDGLSKLDKIEFRSHKQAQAENFRKMLLAMASDLRVILIKLADRLHNMRTLGTIRPDKRRRIANETLEIYVPIANRLGLNRLYHELQELAFQHKYPMRHRALSTALKSARGNRREVVSKVLASIQERLTQWGIEAEVFGREKYLYSIYRKMVDKQLTFSKVLDIYGFRVIVQNLASCYLVIGALHSLYKPVLGKFKDYLAMPKENGYQSLHTTLIGPFGMPVEVQVRTTEMHRIAESGVASHWLYKEDVKTLSELQQNTHSWLQSLLELQSATGEVTEFLEHVKIDLYPGQIYVFTPQGKILSLPQGSTSVDFAYAVHTDIGNCCVACRINGDLMPLRTELANGDKVEIITAANANPNPAWLSYVRTGKARAQIRHFLKNAQHEDSVALGERLLGQALRPHGLALENVSAFAWERFLRDRGVRTKREVFAGIGLGKRLSVIVARRLSQAQEKESERGEVLKPKMVSAILINGSDGVAVQLATCCQPIPGDPIIGMIRKGKGLEVHRHDCIHAAKSRENRGRWVDVEWAPQPDRLFDVTIRVLARDARGMLARVASAIAEQASNIHHVSMAAELDMHAVLNLTVQVRDRRHLAKLMRTVRRVPEVIRITRLRQDARNTRQPSIG